MQLVEQRIECSTGYFAFELLPCFCRLWLRAIDICIPFETFGRKFEHLARKFHHDGVPPRALA